MNGGWRAAHGRADGQRPVASGRPMRLRLRILRPLLAAPAAAAAVEAAAAPALERTLRSTAMREVERHRRGWVELRPAGCFAKGDFFTAAGELAEEIATEGCRSNGRNCFCYRGWPERWPSGAQIIYRNKTWRCTPAQA